ncbi:hypothetical protein [Nonomuraea sp. NPDC049750]
MAALLALYRRLAEAQVVVAFPGLRPADGFPAAIHYEGEAV